MDVELAVLNKLKNIPIGTSVTVNALAKKDPSGFMKVVKRLIDCGWSEYEFSNDYSEIKRLDLPEFARTHFKKLRNEIKD